MTGLKTGWMDGWMVDDGVTGACIRVVTVQMNETAKSARSDTWVHPGVCRPDACLFWKVGDYDIIALSLNKYSQLVYHLMNMPSL